MSSIDGSEFEVLHQLDQGVLVDNGESHYGEPTSSADFLERFEPTRHPYIKLSVLMKNDNLCEVPEEFIFSKDFGRIENSQPWTHQDRVVFGRDAQPRNRENVSTIDINLRQNNKVSHKHCQLLLNEGWKQPRKLTGGFLEFLKIASRKESVWYRLPHELYRLVWEMLGSLPKFYLQDIGSKFGTFVKLTAKTQLTEGTLLDNEGAVFSIRQNSLFKVVRVEMNVGMVKRGQLQEKWESVGLKQVNKLEAATEDNESFSYLILCLEDYHQKTRQNYVASCLTNRQTTIVVGRQQIINQIVLNHTKVSRRHCTITHAQNKWMLDDGTSELQRSRNGTWLDIRTADDIQLSRTSQSYAISTGQEFKMGQTYFRFEVFNNN